MPIKAQLINQFGNQRRLFKIRVLICVFLGDDVVVTSFGRVEKIQELWAKFLFRWRGLSKNRQHLDQNHVGPLRQVDFPA